MSSKYQFWALEQSCQLSELEMEESVYPFHAYSSSIILLINSQWLTGVGIQKSMSFAGKALGYIPVPACWFYAESETSFEVPSLFESAFQLPHTPLPHVFSQKYLPNKSLEFKSSAQSLFLKDIT